MNEEQITNEYDSWVSKISKYIIAKSSRLLSSETQKDGRTLLILSSISSLVCIGIIKFKELSSQGIKIEIINEIIFVPLIIEFVCFYFAISFAIEAYSELKAWQFKSLIKDSDAETPIKIVERANEQLGKKSREILYRYSDLLEQASRELGLDTPQETPPQTKDLTELQNFAKKMDERYENIEKLNSISENYEIEKQKELKEVEIKRQILNFKIESLKQEVPAVVKVYKFKYFINILFPFLSFFFSLLALIFYFFEH